MKTCIVTPSRLWKCRQCVSPKVWYLRTSLHVVTTQNIIIGLCIAFNVHVLFTVECCSCLFITWPPKTTVFENGFLNVRFNSKKTLYALSNTNKTRIIDSALDLYIWWTTLEVCKQATVFTITKGRWRLNWLYGCTWSFLGAGSGGRG
jgi:hypothetical protein